MNPDEQGLIISNIDAVVSRDIATRFPPNVGQLPGLSAGLMLGAYFPELAKELVAVKGDRTLAETGAKALVHGLMLLNPRLHDVLAPFTGGELPVYKVGNYRWCGRVQ